MKSLKKPKSHKKTIILLALLIVLAGAGTAYAAMQKIGPFSSPSSTATESTEPAQNDINTSPPTDDQIDAGEQTATDKEPQKPSPTPPDNSEPGTSKRQAQVTIDSVNQTGTTLRIRASINTIDADSKCTATLTRVSTTAFTETVDTQTMPSYSMCKGFNIPVANLEKGAWKLTISYESKNFKGETTQEVSVQ
ncbi:MAG TPA: hypothetical protein VD907_05940 [Verrucomicrobiae bacterium]|nr:hypothetical protein [Verrucomicrobiae bacterium]